MPLKIRFKRNKRWNPSSKWKQAVIRNLTELANKLRVEAVFPEDYKDVNKLDDALKFLNALSMQPYNKGKCPICGSKSVVEGIIDHVTLNGKGKTPEWMEKLDGVQIRRCENCHSYTIEGW